VDNQVYDGVARRTNHSPASFLHRPCTPGRDDDFGADLGEHWFSTVSTVPV